MSTGAQIWLGVFALLSTVFAAWPELDIAVSGMFHGPGGWIGDGAVPQFMRKAIWTLTEILLLCLVGALGVGLLAGPARRVPLRLSGFGLGAMVLGPGLLVNVLLKDHWGRVRPRNLVDFGGSGSFTPPFRITGGCDGNCSFVSGEVAGVTALALVIWLVAQARLSPPRHRHAAVALVSVVSVVAILRVAAGGHFLSDVLFAILFMLATTALVWRAGRVASAAPALTLSAFRHDLAAAGARVRTTGHRLRGGLARATVLILPHLPLTARAVFRRCSGAKDRMVQTEGTISGSRGEGG